MENKIYGAISRIVEEIGAVTKDKKSQQGYMYRGIDDVMNALQPLLAKHKVFIVPEVIEHTREERATRNDSKLIYSIMKIKYTFFAEDGSSVETVVIGEGMDSSDKSSNKAMAIAFKYACFQVFCIPTEEMPDPDKDSHDLSADNNSAEEPKPAQEKFLISEKQIKRLFAIKNEAKISDDTLKKLMAVKFKKNSVKDLTREEYDYLCENMEKMNAQK